MLTALLGASILVIVRQCNTDASVALTRLDLRRPADKAPVLALVIQRSGNQSVYGYLTISFTPHKGSEQVITRANGVAIYIPNHLRRASITLAQLNGSRLTKGTLRVTYREQAEDGGALLAKRVLQLP